MMLVEKKGENSYTAKVVRESEGVDWESSEPMTLGEVSKKLKELGCHPLDVQGVLAEAARYGRGHFG